MRTTTLWGRLGPCLAYGKANKKYDQVTVKRDHVDIILEEWARERPDLDTSVIGVIGRISRLARLFERRTGATFTAFGLSRGGFAVLAALRRSGPPYRLSPTELYHALLVSSGAMTNRIDRLEERGVVARIPDNRDRRGMLVQLTPKGLALIDEVFSLHVRVEEELLRPLAQPERAELARILRRLTSELEAESKDGARDLVL